jgi:hypothetical protein
VENLYPIALDSNRDGGRLLVETLFTFFFVPANGFVGRIFENLQIIDMKSRTTLSNQEKLTLGLV